MATLTLTKDDKVFDYNFETSTEALSFSTTMTHFGYVFTSIYIV